MKHVTRQALTEAAILALPAAENVCPGRLYLSSDTNKVWIGLEGNILYGPIARQQDTPNFYGDYPNDTVAGQNGVPTGGIYFLTPANGYGQPAGNPKKRTEQP